MQTESELSFKQKLAMVASYRLYKIGCFFERLWNKRELDWSWELYVFLMRASAEIDFKYNIGIWSDSIEQVDLSKNPDFYNGL